MHKKLAKIADISK